MIPLLVDLGNEWRGGQNQGLLLLQGLRSFGVDPELLTLTDSLLGKRAVAEGIRVHFVSARSRRIRGGLKLRSLLSENRISLVHANEPHAVSASWLGRAHRKVPVIISRRVEFPIANDPISRARYKAADCIIANTNWVAKHLVADKIRQSKVTVVYEGTAIPPETREDVRAAAKRIWGLSEAEFLFGCPSAFVPEKGQEHLVKAMASVVKTFPNAKLLLAGVGRCRSEVEALAGELDLKRSVLFPGFVDDMKTFYEALDAFLFPSEIEGLGSAMPTAMAYGLPCISTDRGGLAEIVEDRKTALVVQPDAGEFATAMICVMEDAQLRAQLGSTARAAAKQRFSAKKMTAETLQVYRNVLRARAVSNAGKKEL
jgi:L-malate glycosyltransferase